MTFRRLLLAFLALLAVAAIVGGVVAWTKYREAREEYDAYRELIQPGIRVAGVSVGGLTPEEATAQVTQEIVEPYLDDFILYYQDEALTLSPADDLGLAVPVDEMVDEAVRASHQYDYWEGFRQWVQGETIELDMDVPLQITFDRSAAPRLLADIAAAHDAAPVEPMVDIQARSYIPGRSGWRMDLEESASMVNERVLEPSQREVSLPISPLVPDQSQARIESMLSTLGPVMELAPTSPIFFTDTLPLSTTVELEAASPITHSGALTWTLPHFISYTGHLTSTYAYFFQPGEPGYTFDVERARQRVQAALQAGATEPIAFEPDLVPPAAITPSLLLPPLEARLAQFPGVTSILVKDLDTGELIYESNADYVLSGMSIVKIGIMVDVYRHHGGSVDEQTHQELVDMLGSESCNPCANRLMAQVGAGSPQAGARRVTATMRTLGLANFYLCAPFRVVELWGDESQTVWTAYGGGWLAQSEIPRYDNCVKTTPREMAALVEMIYECTEDEGTLREILPEITPQACQEMVEIMAANDLRNMLGAGIPHEVTLAHKHGFSGYDVPWGDTRGEVGIVYSPGATWLISFYIWQDSPWINWGINQPLYRDVSNLLYNYFNPEEPYWPLPPWTEPPAEEEASDSDA